MDEVKIRQRQTLKPKGKGGEDVSTATSLGVERSSSSSSTSTADSEDDATIGTRTEKLASFLQRCSVIFDVLLSSDDTKDRKTSSSSDHGASSGGILFDENADWVELGTDKDDGGMELVRSRSIASARFSVLQPHVLISAHLFPETDEEKIEEDLKAHKGLYCVWDVGLPGGPQFVLVGAGQPSCVAFSSTQSHIVVAGTEEGSLLMWNLHESAAIHRFLYCLVFFLLVCYFSFLLSTSFISIETVMLST